MKNFLKALGYFATALAFVLSAVFLSSWISKPSVTPTSPVPSSSVPEVSTTIVSPTKAHQEQTEITATSTPEVVMSGDVLELFALTNKDRANHGLYRLLYNATLQRAAEAKANDMASKGYFAHTTPEGFTFTHFVIETGYKYTDLGENLAFLYPPGSSLGFSTIADAERAFMNSPEHRENILGEKYQYTDIGIGFAKGMYKGNIVTFIAIYFTR